MSTITTDTWIVGCGEATSALSRDDVSITEFAWEAIEPALQDAGTRLADVEGGVTASQDFWDGRTISSMSVNEIAGGTFRSEAKIASDACLALGYALARVQDGDQHLNVVVAHAKESQAEAHTIELAAFDPYFERALDPDDTVITAFQAQQLYARGTFTPEHAARVVAAARRPPPTRCGSSTGRRSSMPPRPSSSATARPPTGSGARGCDSPGQPRAPRPTGASATTCATLRSPAPRWPTRWSVPAGS